MQTSRVEIGHIFTQTSRKDNGPASHTSTQTSKRRPPHRTTQTSRRLLPDIGVQTSLVAQPVHKSSSEQSQFDSSDDRSSTGFISPALSYASCDNNGSDVIAKLQRHNAVLKKHVHEQMLDQEKDALKERMQMDLSIGQTSMKYVIIVLLQTSCTYMYKTCDYCVQACKTTNYYVFA